ncbi:unnamed protein product [Microthlaspi erraticum]|nr:unnamed protein product [Microthlaspi erraticum]
MPKTYWPYAFATAVYLINRMPTEVLNNDSLYAKLFDQPPNYLKLRVFGSLCFPWLRPYTNHKLDDRSAACVFVGYSLSQSAYLCLHVATGRVYTSRHVQFVESSFPFAVTPSDLSPASEENPNDSTSTLVPLTPAPLVSAPPQLAPLISDLHHSHPSSATEPGNRVNDDHGDLSHRLGQPGNSTGPSRVSHTLDPSPPGPNTNPPTLQPTNTQPTNINASSSSTTTQPPPPPENVHANSPQK